MNNNFRTSETSFREFFNKLGGVCESLSPPPDLKVSEWADRCRKLSPEASAESGSWSTSRAEYQRTIMNCANDTKVKQVVVMSAAQIGKALDINTSIPTPSGYTKMGDLNI